VAFIFNLKSGAGEAEAEIEWDTPETISAIEQALSVNCRVIPLEAGENIGEGLKEARPDIVFNYAEGVFGEMREAEIPALLESMGLPYTGSAPDAMRNCLNKARTKTILREHRIKTPDFTVVHSADEHLDSLRFPCIVKPVWEGSSKGIHEGAVAGDAAQARKLAGAIINRHRQPALVETFLPGREFTVGIIGNGDELMVLPLIEIDHSAIPAGMSPILSYEAKWIIDNPENPIDILRCPARVDIELEEKIKNIGVRSFQALGVRDWCRIDIRLDGEGAPSVIELNPLPGLLPCPEDNSCMPAAARAAGFSYEELVNMVLRTALKRYGMEEAI